jgi:hypothetical protein
LPFPAKPQTIIPVSSLYPPTETAESTATTVRLKLAGNPMDAGQPQSFASVQSAPSTSSRTSAFNSCRPLACYGKVLSRQSVANPYPLWGRLRGDFEKEDISSAVLLKNRNDERRIDLRGTLLTRASG